MLKDIVKNPEEQSVRGPSEAKHERGGQSPQDVGQLAEAGNGSSKMVFAQRSSDLLARHIVIHRFAQHFRFR